MPKKNVTEQRTKFTADAKQLTSTLSKMQKSFKKISGQLRVARGLANDFGNTMKRVSVGIVASLGLAAREFAKTEDNILKVKSVLKLTGDETDTLFKKVRKIARETPKDAADVAKAAEELAKGGIGNLDVVTKALEPTIKLAVTAGIDVGTAADYAVSAMKGMGLGVKDLTGLMDVWTATADASNTTVEEIAKGFKKAVGEANKMKVPYDELTTLFGLVAPIAKGEEAGTIVYRMLKGLSDSSEELAKLGVNVYDLAGNTRPMLDVIQEYMELVKNAPNDAEANRLIGLLGEVRGERGLAAIFEAGEEGLKRLVKVADESSGSTEKKFNILMLSMTNKYNSMMSMVKDFAIQVGQTFAPEIEAGFAWVTELFRKMTDYMKNNKQGVIDLKNNLITFGKVLVGIFVGSKILGTIGRIGYALTALPTIIGAITVAVKAMGSAFLWAWAKMLIGPGALVIAGAAIVATIAYAAYQFRYQIVKAVNSIIDVINSAIDKLPSGLKGLLGDAKIDKIALEKNEETFTQFIKRKVSEQVEKLKPVIDDLTEGLLDDGEESGGTDEVLAGTKDKGKPVVTPPEPPVEEPDTEQSLEDDRDVADSGALRELLAAGYTEETAAAQIKLAQETSKRITGAYLDAAEVKRRALAAIEQKGEDERLDIVEKGLGKNTKALFKFMTLGQKAKRKSLIEDMKARLHTDPQAAFNTTSKSYGAPMGPILGAIHAAAVFATGLKGLRSAMQSYKVKFYDGGIAGSMRSVQGGAGMMDGANAKLNHGELIVPTRNFDEVINAMVDARGGGEGGENTQNINIYIDGEQVTNKVIERLSDEELI